MTLAEEFRTFVGGRKIADRQKSLALDVADALENVGAAKLWSQLNLREEFASRRAEAEGGSGWLEFLSSVAYILPVLGAWLHLQGAFSAYAKTVAQAGSKVQINFLAFWTGAYDNETWVHRTTTASGAALTVILLVLVIISLQGVVGWRNSRLESTQADLDDLVLRATLEFAKNRAVTPEELSNGINEAAARLGEGLGNLRQAFDDTTELVREVQGVTGTITESAGALKSAADSLVEVMMPLTNFGQSADSAARVLRSTAEAVDVARTAFEVSAKAGTTSISGAGDLLTTELRSHAQSMENVRDAVAEVSDSVVRAATGLQQVVQGSGVAATRVNSLAGDLSGVSDSIASAASSLSTVVKTLVEANKSMGEIAESANSREVTSYITAVRNHAEAMLSGAKLVQEAVSVLGQELRKWHEGRN